MTFIEIYKDYLNTLEAISGEHEELTDTDVRERLHEVINWYFVWGNPIDPDFPLLYGMFSPEGDEQVAKATKIFMEQSTKAVADVSLGEERNTLIEDISIATVSGETYDLYLGSAETALPAEEPSSDGLYGDYDE